MFIEYFTLVLQVLCMLCFTIKAATNIVCAPERKTTCEMCINYLSSIVFRGGI